MKKYNGTLYKKKKKQTKYSTELQETQKNN
jgi:hypothetical protein